MTALPKKTGAEIARRINTIIVGNMMIDNAAGEMEVLEKMDKYDSPEWLAASAQQVGWTERRREAADALRALGVPIPVYH